MNLCESNLQDLDAMTQIIHSCRSLLNLESEIRWNKESLQQAMIQSSGQVLGAYHLNELVGFVLFKELSGTESINKDRLLKFSAMNEEKIISSCLEIWCLATLPIYQGQGVMGTLLKELKATTREIWLEVHELNTKAINFYKNQTFQQVGSRSNYYKDGKNALLFTWKAEQ
jgi:ribosomal protein S18 acetylase RimI-like enzyme